ncbi:MAG TPA: DUF819 family protein [Candidatus Omnitrophota bacterium]|nr:DUF819 family protein [Candidatus Omnitrophota bacterium]
MIHNPAFLIGFLLFVETLILYLAAHPHFKKYFNFLPAVFWIYFLPMLFSTFGAIDSKSPIYSKISTHLLPASLFLLLISVDIKAIFQLGKPALLMFFVGSAGIILGAPVVYFLFKPWIGAQTWSGFGALSASWTGGSANMIAVKEALGVPDSVFLPMVIVDTVVPYVWMGTLVAFAGFQNFYDRMNHSNRNVLDELSRRISSMDQLKGGNSKDERRFDFKRIAFLAAFAVVGSWSASAIANFLPEIKGVISTYAWTIIVVTFLGILCSLTPLKRLEQWGSNRLGYFMLYFVLTTIGAKASITHIGSSLILIAAGFVLVLIHAGVLLLVSKWKKIPLFLVAVASQANIGGVASAPIVAEIYQPGFASVGLLLAILGNIVGTYFGILTGQLCRWVGGG